MLAFLANQQLTFNIPTVLFYTYNTNRTYLFKPRMSGQMLNEVWWDINAEKRQLIAALIAEVCYELAAFESDNITKTDLNWMNPLCKQRDNTPKALRKHCKGLGMDCSIYIFSHNDLGLTNILIDNRNRLAVIDWDIAGYCPWAWMRTKFAICGALDVERVRKVETDSKYRMLVEGGLKRLGFLEVTKAYKELKKARSKE